ncbi:MAG: gamma-glutamyltransferase [Brevundimonas sp.]|jgi:gamma-glutamyltranspeptidase/glutathione hydrolase|uniref:gamma-glutamyltransferase n=1 Tax=Brevundimonas sp. TaxID=1871086 RepID=UPI0025C6464D|nr:gamma-glutamyltransferase [Brevundimonas sp.]MCH4267598.1 gamma-glutamyltransferase [Brevundimonas sp.]
MRFGFTRAATAVSAAALMLLAGPGLAQQTAQVRPTTGSGGDIVNYGQIHSPLVGRGGMVVSQSDPATRVGVEILRQGGNAVDSAVAVAFAEAVTLPRAGNIGGSGYMIVHMAATADRPAQDIAVNYYGAAPAATTPELLLGPDGRFDRSKPSGFINVSVPGTVMGLWEAHSRFGSMPWADLVAPAIRLAEEGYVLSDGEADATAGRARVLATDPGAREAYLKPDGSVYRAGETFRQPLLAESLRKVARGGADEFYKGELARQIVAGIQAQGGVITLEDMAAYRADVSEPIWGSYRGNRISFMPPTASGVSVAEALNLLEHFDLKAMGWGSVDSLHLISEAMKITSSDRRLIGGAPQWTTPAHGLASKEFAAERVKLIALDRTLKAADIPEGNPYPYESQDTTHYSVADAFGNAVSNTYTLSNSYGAHVAPVGTGILLNNHLDNFSWGTRGEPNSPAPGKRLGSTITPMIVFKDDKPWLITGTPGGGYIIATMVQLISNVVDHNLNVAEAAMRPRLNQGGGDSPLELEGGFSPDVERLLRERGHTVRPSMTMGSTQSIMVDGDRFLGAADTRRPDALALGVR